MARDSVTFCPHLFRRSEWAEDWFAIYNKRYFHGSLPPAYVGFYPRRKMGKSFAWTIRPDGFKYATHILLNPYFKTWPDVTKQNILHEMIHVKFRNRHAHGPRFKKEMRRLLLAGAFDDTL